ncbi:hypothetical protein BIV25_06995 [Streptomyces sp. MUSC 14]|nr:hypothetical protein BIV25_06995 [Streptomyces sp. MUSC 14]
MTVLPVADPGTGRLIGSGTGLRTRRACRIIESTGRPVPYQDPPDATLGRHGRTHERGRLRLLPHATGTRPATKERCRATS